MSENTARVRVQEQLIMLAAGIGTWRYDVDQDAFSGDQLVWQMLGLTDAPDELTCEALLNRVHPESAEPLRKYLTGEQSIVDTHSLVIRIPKDDEDDRLIVARARMLPGQTGAGTLVGTVLDDTEHQHLQRDVRDREDWLQMLVRGVPQSFMYMDHNQRIVFANDVFLKNTNWVGKDVRGKHLSEIHGQELYAARTQYIDEALRGETVSYEALGRKGEGMGFFHHEFKPHLDKGGNVIGIFATATDISDRHDIERQLEAKQQELVRSNQDLEQFAYVASHDLKAPLRAIEVLVQWLRDDLTDYEGGEVHENLDLLGQRTKRLTRLLDDLLAYSRIGRKVGEVVEVDCNEQVTDLVELMGLPENMTVEIEGELPVFTTYAAPLEQVFRNLIGNATKHHPGPAGKVTVSCADEDDFYVFSVTDDGEGIPQEYAERVFQMFQTLKPRDEVEGSGMGLAIVSRIVDWQGGRIWFEPGPDGRGTLFNFQWKKAARGSGGTQLMESPTCRQAAK